jgi:hypothetical protein
LGALHSSLFAQKRQVKKRGRENMTKGERGSTEVAMAVAAAVVVVIGRSLVIFPHIALEYFSFGFSVGGFREGVEKGIVATSTFPMKLSILMCEEYILWTNLSLVISQ